MTQGEPLKVAAGIVVGLSVLLLVFDSLANPGSRTRKVQANSATTFSLQAGRQWNLTALGSQELNQRKGRRRPFIQFNLTDSIAYGFSGCNSFHCKLSSDQSGNIRFSQITNTLIACLAPNPEEAFVAGLQNARKAKIQENELWIMDAFERPLLKFKASDTP